MSENQKHSGVLISAKNGDVIGFDDTGLLMKLSDQVIADIAARMDASSHEVDASVLGDIDAWSVRDFGSHYKFVAHLKGMDFPREYIKFKQGGEIFAASSGSLLGILSIGGARRSWFAEDQAFSKYHIVCPSDDLRAVGHHETGEAEETEFLEQAAVFTRDVAIANALLDHRREDGRALALFFARTQTTTSTSLSDIGKSKGYQIFLATADNLKRAASALGKRAHVLAVGIDFLLEDAHSNADEYERDFFALLAQIEADLAARGFRQPFFVQSFEAGGFEGGAAPIILAQWQISWRNSFHKIAYSAPSYIYEYDEFMRPNANSLVDMGEMDAAAIESLERGENWHCPIFLLARKNGKQVRVIAQSMDDLVIDADNPFDCDAGHGFVVEGAKITKVEIAGDDGKALILHCDREPETGAKLRYAYGAAPRFDGRPANRGNIRDDWQFESQSGRKLGRFALPAELTIFPEHNA